MIFDYHLALLSPPPVAAAQVWIGKQLRTSVMKRTVEEKVLAIFHELAGERASQIKVVVPAAQQTIAQALASEHPVKWHATSLFT